MTSKAKETSLAPTETYVWIWLPGTSEPVVAGRIAKEGALYQFNYGRSYLERENAIPIHAAELPLNQGVITPQTGLTMAGCLRDGSPDAWGRRVLINKLFGQKGVDTDSSQLDELTYLLESGSDRIGALDFQVSAVHYRPRMASSATFEELQQAAEYVEKGVPLTPELGRALHHGSSIGGARPKVLIVDGPKKYIAKFSALGDLYSVVKAEFTAMRLADYAGIEVAPVKLVRSAQKDVILVERFDRAKSRENWHRHAMISALTLLKLDEMMARYASYEDLAQIIRYEFADPKNTLKELFKRLVFNILIGNTDDHARNHAALWDGQTLSLSPAYDLCPQPRAGGEATQAMLIKGNDRSSQITTCLGAVSTFLLSQQEGLDTVADLIDSIGMNWAKVCKEADLSETDRRLLAGRQFLNPYAFEGLTGGKQKLSELGESVRRQLG
jgi:serine/threonine-protein kinase HipA